MILTTLSCFNAVNCAGGDQAVRLMHRHRSWNKVIKALRFEATIAVPPGYELGFEKVR